MNFKSFINGKKVIEEISQKFVDKLPKGLKDKIKNNELPFNSIFGDKLRIIDRLKTGAKDSPIVQDLKSLLEYKYVIDFDNWIVYKPSQPKNKIRIGKALTNEKQRLEKHVETIESVLSLQISNKQEFDSRMEKTGWTIETLQDQLKFEKENIVKIDSLLKTTNLEKQFKASTLSDYFIVYSRAPIDVLRMSDFDTTSCHAEGGDFFYCVLADSMLNAGVIYLLKEDDALNNNLLNDDALQRDEIFSDSSRNIRGARPIARMRIRRVFDAQGHELAVPTTKIYGNAGLSSDFRKQVVDWAKKQDVSDFNFDDTLRLVGGSYEDVNHSISNEIKSIWGKDVRYRHDSSTEQKFRDEEGDVYEANFWEQVRDELYSNEDSKIIAPIFEDRYKETNVNISIDNAYTVADIRYFISNSIIKQIGSENMDKLRNDGINGWKLDNSDNHLAIQVEMPSIYDYGEYYGEYDASFDFDDYYYAAQEVIVDAIRKVTEEDFRRGSEVPLYCDALFNAAILKFAGVSDEQLGDGEIYELLNDFSNSYEFSVVLENQNIKLDINDRNIIRPPKLSDPVHPVIVVSAMEFTKLKNFYDFVSNHFYEKFKNFVYNSLIYKQSSTETDETFQKRLSSIGDDVKNNVLREFDFETTIHFNDKFLDKPLNNLQYAYIVNVNEPLKEQLDNKLKIAYSHNYEEPIVAEINIGFDQSVDNINSLGDKNIGMYVYRILDSVRDASNEDEFDITEELLGIEELEQKLRDYKSYKRINSDGDQLQFDFSGINRYMNKFDGYVFEILKELNMAKGGISNQSGGTQTSNNAGSSNVQKNSSFTKKPNTSSVSPNSINNNGNVQVSVDLDSVLSDQKMKGQWGNWLKDPNNAEALKTQYNMLMSDPKADQNKREQFLNVINSDKELSNYVFNLNNTP
jgi:hypothetical protein